MVPTVCCMMQMGQLRPSRNAVAATGAGQMHGTDRVVSTTAVVPMIELLILPMQEMGSVRWLPCSF
jgi:hypothetical protein